MNLTVDGRFLVEELGKGKYSLSFTQAGLKEFGTLFVCESLVKKNSDVTAKTKLFCVEGFNMLQCIRSPFKTGKVEAISKFLDASEINDKTTILTVKDAEIHALSVM